MSSFSTRYGYKGNTIQIESVSKTLRGRIYNAFFQQEYPRKSIPIHYASNIERLLVEFGIPYDVPDCYTNKEHNMMRIKKLLFDGEWYIVYDFIEKYLEGCTADIARPLTRQFNRILEEEASGYRVVKKQVVPVTNETELMTIEKASSTKYTSVNNHISKALTLYSDRKNPDYENSVKESISAVEAMCCIITGMTGKDATLGAALKKLKDKGMHIHKAMESAFSSLYGYASNENGIRHGGIDFTDVPAEDAKYMLVSCSAFVNYLIEKWSKISNS